MLALIPGYLTIPLLSYHSETKIAVSTVLRVSPGSQYEEVDQARLIVAHFLFRYVQTPTTLIIVAWPSLFTISRHG